MNSGSAQPDSIERASAFIHGSPLEEQLSAAAKRDPNRVYLLDEGRPVTVGEIEEGVTSLVRVLGRLGISGDSRVGVALPVGKDHVVTIFALLRLRALWIPLNPQLIGEPLGHQLRDSDATHVLCESGSPLAQDSQVQVFGELRALHGPGHNATVFATFPRTAISADNGSSELQGACLLMYTSGTTGPPKGALVTETMLRAAVLGAIEVSQPKPGDVFYVWEPLFHIGGAQVVFLPLFEELTLAMVPRFSASRFWDDMLAYDVTHIHYLGGILQILLQLPQRGTERENRVRIAWGAGATPEVRAACEDRFAFALHECYGMTEASSIVTVNSAERDGGVGRPLPWVDVSVRSDERLTTSRADGPRVGEILVRGQIEGLITPGYLGNPEATAKILDGEWFCTGDNGYFDAAGRLHFTGRASDSIRVRGENISAWQIESVFSLHPAVERCAVVGVEAAIGEQEMALFYTLDGAANIEPEDLLEWGKNHLARFQIPRYVRLLEEMPLTPSQRVAKHRLPKFTECVSLA
ncbi:class I adenylate-forming enzyme family protein [Leucobacter aridicollis]|uniref:Crotonobetaine/carnitine-CoA ligase n=1 Tax=Leucobacter aridicollis TaxID=283878 RepID=A0A852QUP4_9MICO|nr:AMP-binding protein [Leucobacter aridicollis]MBL3682575.1 ATP-dependent acyl-CoA ligase [Leucobacter aridicollis]NYD25993.1 crotonobetaine/carnitine-CoA ligase [Leucobacter aridicollis]